MGWRIKLSGKCSDSCDIIVTDDNGNEVLERNADDVPRDMCIGGGDYLRLEIDIGTGQIIGWDADKVITRIAELRGDDD